MSEPSIIAEPYPPAAWRETVICGLDRHNVAITGLADYYPVGFFVFRQGREAAAGLRGDIWGGRMHVARLWVAPGLRGSGLGAALVASAHRYALTRGCTHSFLRTSSYEARPFYEKLGYAVYAELGDHPIAPHRRYFMSCALESAPPAAQSPAVIAMDPYPAREIEDTVAGGIEAHANAAIGAVERAPLNFFLRADGGEIVGGVLGDLWGDWMYARCVWVERGLRGRGHAARLMTAAERGAVAWGCKQGFLSTFSFQARPFYEKLGYCVFGELADYPHGHSLYHMAKALG